MPQNPALKRKELIRYGRQMLLPDWAKTGQEKLKRATVFIAGLGGLGSPVSVYLACAGIGRLRICDCGKVEISNLNRQTLYNHKDVGKFKAIRAASVINKINPFVKIEAFCDKITRRNVGQLIGDAGIIVDCLDNFPTRYILNEFAAKNKTPLIHGSIWGLEGRLTAIHVPHTPCLSCIFPKPPPGGTFPVVGAAPGVIGCLQAAEVIKYIVGLGGNLYNQLLVVNAKNMFFKKLKLKANPRCPVCSPLRRYGKS